MYATEKWKREVAKYVALYKGDRKKAVAAANRKNPGLRQQMVAEVNEDAGRSHVVRLPGHRGQR